MQKYSKRVATKQQKTSRGVLTLAQNAFEHDGFLRVRAKNVGLFAWNGPRKTKTSRKQTRKIRRRIKEQEQNEEGKGDEEEENKQVTNDEDQEEKEEQEQAAGRGGLKER